MTKPLRKIFRENRSFILFLALMFVFRSAVADWNTVPTGSMKPTILEGDRILVSKMAYDIRVPFTHIPIVEISNPVRGDIIVFDSKASQKRLVKRVIGIPGDTVTLENNRLNINGKNLDYSDISSSSTHIDKLENLLGIKHRVRVSKRNNSFMANFQAIEIPDDYYLVLGDNRDNSADSRVIGLVPRREIVGRADSVVLSLNYDNYYLPRSDRYLLPL